MASIFTKIINGEISAYKITEDENFLAFLDVNNVYGGIRCTFTEHEQFYSYRRDRQTGRMATLIWRE